MTPLHPDAAATTAAAPDSPDDAPEVRTFITILAGIVVRMASHVPESDVQSEHTCADEQKAA